jgi:hypothetical protein
MKMKYAVATRGTMNKVPLKKYRRNLPRMAFIAER